MAEDYKLTHTGAELDNAIKAVSNGVYKSSIYVPTGTADNLTFTLTDADTVDKTYGSTPISFGNIKGATGAMVKMALVLLVLHLLEKKLINVLN